MTGQSKGSPQKYPDMDLSRGQDEHPILKLVQAKKDESGGVREEIQEIGLRETRKVKEQLPQLQQQVQLVDEELEDGPGSLYVREESPSRKSSKACWHGTR